MIGGINFIVYTMTLRGGQLCNQAPFALLVVFGDYALWASLNGKDQGVEGTQDSTLLHFILQVVLDYLRTLAG